MAPWGSEDNWSPTNRTNWTQTVTKATVVITVTGNNRCQSTWSQTSHPLTWKIHRTSSWKTPWISLRIRTIICSRTLPLIITGREIRLSPTFWIPVCPTVSKMQTDQVGLMDMEPWFRTRPWSTPWSRKTTSVQTQTTRDRWTQPLSGSRTLQSMVVAGRLSRKLWVRALTRLMVAWTSRLERCTVILLTVTITSQLHRFPQCLPGPIGTELKEVSTWPLKIAKMLTDTTELKYRRPKMPSSHQITKPEQKTPRLMEMSKICISKGNRAPQGFNRLFKTWRLILTRSVRTEKQLLAIPISTCQTSETFPLPLQTLRWTVCLKVPLPKEEFNKTRSTMGCNSSHQLR